MTVFSQSSQPGDADVVVPVRSGATQSSLLFGPIFLPHLNNAFRSQKELWHFSTAAKLLSFLKSHPNRRQGPQAVRRRIPSVTPGVPPLQAASSGCVRPFLGAGLCRSGKRLTNLQETVPQRSVLQGGALDSRRGSWSAASSPDKDGQCDKTLWTF